jgi:quercetin 2,3-dioxygenase
MIIRRSAERGQADHGWLRSAHTFSFADYRDPRHMGFLGLRVINEDRVAPGKGFGTHGHRDMEIISYLLEGQLQHRDSMGNGSVIRVGDVQQMSAGTGVRHSEFNASASEPVHFLQIWLLPDRPGHSPRYAQVHVPAEELRGRLRLIASPDGRDGSVAIHQDSYIHALRLDGPQELELELAPGRGLWLQVARGRLHLEGEALEAGDGARLDPVSEARRLRLTGGEGAEALIFDLSPRPTPGW